MRTFINWLVEPAPGDRGIWKRVGQDSSLVQKVGLASGFLLLPSVKDLNNNQEINKTQDAGVREGRKTCWWRRIAVKCQQLPLQSGALTLELKTRVEILFGGSKRGLRKSLGGSRLEETDRVSKWKWGC